MCEHITFITIDLVMRTDHIDDDIFVMRTYHIDDDWLVMRIYHIDAAVINAESTRVIIFTMFTDVPIS